jgi:DNA ligase (NAD+)
MQNYENEIRELINKINYYTKLYDEGKPEISDKEWDNLYFKLVALESKTGIYFEDSPTQRINYQVVNKLNKVEHSHPMLSLDKTKDINDIKSFIGSKNYIAMAKMDGLTCSLTYENGKLIKAETRGNGIIGEDILHNALQVKNIPNKINYKNKLVVDGEIICTYKDFEPFANEYKNPRNFASGSIRLLDSKESASRNLSFITWDLIEGFTDNDFLSTRLIELRNIGFTIVPFYCNRDIEESVELIKKDCKDLGYPIDGIVFKYDEVKDYEAAGRTDHHFKGGLAYKFYDEEYETTLKDIEWTMGRTGQLCPIAIFEKLDIDGTEISRASLCNISIMKQTLGEHPFIGQKIIVTKRNQIIPKIEKAKGEDGNWI